MIRSHTPPANVTRSILACGLLVLAVHFACGSTAVDQIPHLQSLPDATDSLQHQINIANSHISYNRGGGIVVRDGNVRNLQVAGCDIEANMPGDTTPTRTANILIDVTGYPESRDKSVAEIAITGCTIQHSANYGGSETATLAPGGANIRLAGKAIYPIDSVTITGNVLSDTTTNIDINHAMDVAVSANNFFAPKPAHLTVKNSRRVVVTGNTFNPRQFVRPGNGGVNRIHPTDTTNSDINGVSRDRNGVTHQRAGSILNLSVFKRCKSLACRAPSLRSLLACWAKRFSTRIH